MALSFHRRRYHLLWSDSQFLDLLSSDCDIPTFLCLGRSFCEKDPSSLRMTHFNMTLAAWHGPFKVNACACRIFHLGLFKNHSFSSPTKERKGACLWKSHQRCSGSYTTVRRSERIFWDRIGEVAPVALLFSRASDSDARHSLLQVMTCKGRRDTIQAPPLHTQEQVFTDAQSTFQSDSRVELGLKYNWMPHAFGHISSISCSLMHRRCGTEAIHICTVHVGATVFFEVKNKENQAKWPQETSERFLCFTLRIPRLCALHPPLGLRSHFQLVKTPQDLLRMKWIKAHGDLGKR